MLSAASPSVRPLEENVADVTVAVKLANPQQIRQHQLSSATTAMAQKDKSGKSRFRSSVIASGGAEDQHVFLLPTGMFLEHFLAANRSPGRVS